MVKRPRQRVTPACGYASFATTGLSVPAVGSAFSSTSPSSRSRLLTCRTAPSETCPAHAMPVHALNAQAIGDALAPFGARVTRVPVTRAEICAMARPG